MIAVPALPLIHRDCKANTGPNLGFESLALTNAQDLRMTQG